MSFADISETKRLAWGFSEIAEATGLSVNFLRNEERRGKLKAHRFGRRLLIRTEDLVAYINSCPNKPKEEQA